MLFGLKTIVHDSLVILNNIVQLRAGVKLGIHFPTVSIFGRMAGKNRYFWDVSQHVLFKACTVSCLPNLCCVWL